MRFPIDRAGFVGADGPTHAGSFDTTYLAMLPGFVVMAAADEAELKHMVRTAAAYDEGPISFRYPRGEGVGVEMPERGEILEIGKGRIVKEGTKVALAVLRHPACRMPAGGRRPRRRRAVDHGRRCALCQAARPRPDPPAGAPSRGADHHRGRLRRRLRQPCAAVPRPRRPARRRAQGAAAGHAGPVGGSGQARGDVCAAPGSTGRASSTRSSRRSGRIRRPCCRKRHSIGRPAIPAGTDVSRRILDPEKRENRPLPRFIACQPPRQRR